jgi:protease II
MGYGGIWTDQTHARHTTFKDFVDAARGLIGQRYAARPDRDPGRIGGGEADGRVVNSDSRIVGRGGRRRTLRRRRQHHVDGHAAADSGEWNEWGNPITIRPPSVHVTYKPYDNVRARPIRRC